MVAPTTLLYTIPFSKKNFAKVRELSMNYMRAWLEVFARSLPAHPTAPQSHTSRSQLASPKGVLEYLRSSRYIL